MYCDVAVCCSGAASRRRHKTRVRAYAKPKIAPLLPRSPGKSRIRVIGQRVNYSLIFMSKFAGTFTVNERAGSKKQRTSDDYVAMRKEEQERSSVRSVAPQTWRDAAWRIWSKSENRDCQKKLLRGWRRTWKSREPAERAMADAIYYEKLKQRRRQHSGGNASVQFRRYT